MLVKLTKRSLWQHCTVVVTNVFFSIKMSDRAGEAIKYEDVFGISRKKKGDLSKTLTRTLSLAITYTHALTLTHVLSKTQSFFSLCIYLSISKTHTHTHTYSHSLTHVGM